MRIAIDATSAARPRRSGVAIYLTDLLDALSRIDRENEYLVCYRLSRLKQRRHFYCPAASNFRTRIFHEPLIFPRKVDIFHGGDSRLPNNTSVTTTVTVHDVFSLMRDDLATKRFREKKQWRYGHIARHADRIIASSQSTAHDLRRLLAIPPERIVVNHLGISTGFEPAGPAEIERVRQKYGISFPYCLCVASFSKRKNVRRVIEAYDALRKERKLESKLVLVGSHEYWEEKDQILGRRNHPDDIVLTQYVPAEDLPAIYSGARMFIFPSLCEGFALPLVEAMACGTPVITSNVSSMPEVIGDAGLLVDPENLDDIRNKMAELDADAQLRRELVERGLQRARRFTCDRNARKLLDLWKGLAAN
ncbi:MAG: glycosyltransferase family 4 protein [Planctomycetes bacterium]|nr:glycosyltransferase family 4 protein [Planctomycetota bacterium]